MSTPARVSGRDLRVLADIVSQDRPDLPAGEGLPPSLLADLMDQIRCEFISFNGHDSGRQLYWFSQGLPQDEDVSEELSEAADQPFWLHFWDCLPCSHADRTGDLRSVVTRADYYSARQWRATGMYTDVYRPQGVEHYLLLTLPESSATAAEPGRHLRLVLHREPGPDFSERDRALLVLLRPHLHQAYLNSQRQRHPVPRLTQRQTELLRQVADGHTNSQIARRLGLSEGTVRTHLDNIYERLGVSNRTAAVIRAFPGSGV